MWPKDKVVHYEQRRDQVDQLIALNICAVIHASPSRAMTRTLLTPVAYRTLRVRWHVCYEPYRKDHKVHREKLRQLMVWDQVTARFHPAGQ